jgi:hypothetical protein
MKPRNAREHTPQMGGFSVGDGAAAGLGRVSLLVRAIARANERAGEHGAEAECLALLA